MIAVALLMDDIFLGYGKKVVVRGVSLEINEGEIVALLGHNGAGKTTTLKSIMGLIQPFKGNIRFYGEDKTAWPPKENVIKGISYVPQGMGLFPDLTVSHNLELACYTVNDDSEIKARHESVYQLFPILKEREWQIAGTLSGGQQRMLSVAMALMTGPKLLLMDEPSLGLAPLLVDQLMETIRTINKQMGTAILLVEQNVKQAFKVAQRAYVMKIGSIILSETTEALQQKEHLWELF
jgi:branched-chain amino acid transport system ATP-binding protein